MLPEIEPTLIISMLIISLLFEMNVEHHYSLIMMPIYFSYIWRCFRWIQRTVEVAQGKRNRYTNPHVILREHRTQQPPLTKPPLAISFLYNIGEEIHTINLIWRTLQRRFGANSVYRQNITTSKSVCFSVGRCYVVYKFVYM